MQANTIAARPVTHLHARPLVRIVSRPPAALLPPPTPRSAAMRKPSLHQLLYVQVVAAILLGIVLGHLAPEFAVKMKPLGDGFIKLIKMLVAPIIFCTIVTGIAEWLLNVTPATVLDPFAHGDIVQVVLIGILFGFALGTSSSESALPRLMQKLERMGCSRSVVGLVVPRAHELHRQWGRERRGVALGR